MNLNIKNSFTNQREQHRQQGKPVDEANDHQGAHHHKEVLDHKVKLGEGQHDDAEQRGKPAMDDRDEHVVLGILEININFQKTNQAGHHSLIPGAQRGQKGEHHMGRKFDANPDRCDQSDLKFFRFIF